MIYGIGIDIIEIERVKMAVTRTAGFMEKVFTKGEIEYFRKKNNNYESLAGIFAAKEAFAKALGLGIRGFSLLDIEVMRNELGKPSVTVWGKAKDIMAELNIENIHLSISHNKSNATAYVVLEKNQEECKYD